MKAAASKLSNWVLLKHDKKPIQKSTVNLFISLFNGQSFTWRQENNVIWGTCYSTYFEFKYDDDEHINFRTVVDDQEGSLEAKRQVLVDYFHLELDYSVFDEIEDEYFKRCYKANNGLRVLRQEPWECFVSFLCSQNNHLKRITSNVESICNTYGELIFDGDRGKFYSFPDPEKIAENASEKELRDLGLGYRAKYILKSSKQVTEKGGRDYLIGLRDEEKDQKVRESLVYFCGIGPKVADCISLYSLDRHNYVPIDTHMLQIYVKVYKHKKPKSASGKAYEDILSFFQKKLGCGGYAGIAHSFLFSEKLGVDYEGKKPKKKSLKRKPQKDTGEIKKELKRTKGN